MPYDPTLPANGSPNSSAEMRMQLQSIVDLISSIPKGDPGQNGSDGTSVSGAIIDSTSTLNPGDAAQASVSWDGANVRFSFGIPRGFDGNTGNNGGDGGQGPQGEPGPPGAPFTNFAVDPVNTLNPGDPASVIVSFDGNAVRLLFGIPRGNDGTNGSDGPQGPPGEVTNTQLSNAISSTSSNTNAVATLDTAFADPDAEALRQRFNELVLALRR